MVLISLLSDLSIVSTDKSSPSLPCYLEHHCDFEFRYFGDCGKLNSTTIKGYKQILGKFGEIQREFVDVYSPDRITIAAEAVVVINTSTGSVASL